MAALLADGAGRAEPVAGWRPSRAPASSHGRQDSGAPGGEELPMQSAIYWGWLILPCGCSFEAEVEFEVVEPWDSGVDVFGF